MYSKSSKVDASDELRRARQELARLQRRTQLLEQRLRNNQQVFVDFESIAKAVGHLIVSAKPHQAVNEALAILGEGSGLDRIYLLKHVSESAEGGKIDQCYTWVGDAPNIRTPDFDSLPFQVFFPNWLGKLQSGENLFGSLENAPDIEHLTLAKQGVVSYLWIPLFTGEKWWGVMGFDHAARERVWHPKEISGYALLANSIMEFLRHQKLERSLQVFQERYEVAARAGQLGVWDWDIAKHQLFLDTSIKNMAGYRAEELGDTLDNWEQVFVPDGKLKWIEELNRRILNREKEFELEHGLSHANGKRLEAYSRGKVIYDNTGNAVRVYGMTTNISHLKAIQDDLRAARDLAEESSKAKTEFMAKMSHEIRTPLNGVLGFATLLKHTQLNSEQEGYLTSLETSSKLLLSMVNNILDFSKIEAGKLDLEERPFNIQRSVETILQVFGDNVVKKGLKIEFDCDEHMPQSVMTDPMRIQQVVLNLIGNAVKFTESGRISIAATWKELKAGRGRLRLAVRDTGIGIEPDRLAAIFEPFTQADSSMTRRFGGSGLGLSICQNILQIMGSRLRVESEVGKGSEFSFEIDLDEGPDEPSLEAESLRTPLASPVANPVPDAVMQQRAKAKILLAEDNALNQQVISKLLNRLGYDAVLVEDGQEAINALKRWSFDLVLMDLMMPVTDGITATRIIRETLPPAKQPVIIALTANSSDEDIESCMEVGMNHFISKPVELDTLERILSEFLEVEQPEAKVAPLESSTNTIAFDEIAGDTEGIEEEEASYQHFDPEYMRKLMGSRSEPDVQDEFCIDGIEVFLDSTKDLVASIGGLYKAERWKEFELAVHNLKGTAKTVGALILGNQALQLELWVQDGHAGPKEDDIQRLVAEYDALREELSRYRSSLLEKNRRIS